MYVQGQVQRDPLVQVFDVDVPVSNGDRFHFKSYRIHSTIWLYDYGQKKWFTAQADNANLSQLQDLATPMPNWIAWIQQAVHAERQRSATGTHYHLEIEHIPYGQAFGVDLSSTTKATIEIDTDPEGFLSRLEASFTLEESDTVLVHQMRYTLSFTHVNRTVPDPLPPIQEADELR